MKINLIKFKSNQIISVQFNKIFNKFTRSFLFSLVIFLNLFVIQCVKTGGGGDNGGNGGGGDGGAGGGNKVPLNSNLQVQLSGSKDWLLENSINYFIRGMGVSVFKDKIVVAGGINNSNQISTKNVVAFDGTNWNTLASLPQERECRYGHCLVADSTDSSLYFVGGFPSGTNAGERSQTRLSSVYKYDGTSWTLLNNGLNIPRAQLATVQYKGKIYAIGGSDSTGKALSSVEVLDEKTGTWTLQSSSLNIPRWGFSAVVYMNKLYVIGGGKCNALTADASCPFWAPLTSTGSVEVFDDASGTWTIHSSSLNWGRFASGMVTYKDKLYAMGGYAVVNGNVTWPGVDVFDGNTWTPSKFSLPDYWYGFGLVNYKENIYAFGEAILEGKSESDLVYRFAPNSFSVDTLVIKSINALETKDEWTDSELSLPDGRGRYAAASVVYQDKLFLIGGSIGGNENINRVDAFDGKRWLKMPPLPKKVYQMKATVWNDKIYVVGGGIQRDGSTSPESGRMDYVQIFDGKTWTAGNNLAYAMTGHEIAILGNKLYAFGGNDRVGFYNPSVVSQQFDGTNWNLLPNMNKARGEFCSASLNGKIYAMGGRGFLGEVRLSDYSIFDGTSWSSLNYALPELMSYCAATSDFKNTIYVIGSGNSIGENASSNVWSFDGTTWASQPSLKTPKAQVAVSVYKGRIYAFGGVNYPSIFSSVEIFPSINISKTNLDPTSSDIKYQWQTCTISDDATCQTGEQVYFNGNYVCATSCTNLEGKTQRSFSAVDIGNYRVIVTTSTGYAPSDLFYSSGL